MDPINADGTAALLVVAAVMVLLGLFDVGRRGPSLRAHWLFDVGVAVAVVVVAYNAAAVAW